MKAIARGTAPRPQQGGFALLLLIAALVVVGGGTLMARMPETQMAQEISQEKAARAQLEKIENALIRFARMNRRLPCPADAGYELYSERSAEEVIVIEDVDHDRNQGGFSEDIHVFRCQVGEGKQGLGSSHVQLINDSEEFHEAAVPWRTLGLRADDALDPWGNRIGYKVYQGEWDLLIGSLVRNDRASQGEDGPVRSNLFDTSGGADPEPRDIIADVMNCALAIPADDDDQDLVADGCLYWTGHSHHAGLFEPPTAEDLLVGDGGNTIDPQILDGMSEIDIDNARIDYELLKTRFLREVLRGYGLRLVIGCRDTDFGCEEDNDLHPGDVENDTNATILANAGRGAAFILISHGPNGYGAHTPDGGIIDSEAADFEELRNVAYWTGATHYMIAQPNVDPSKSSFDDIVRAMSLNRFLERMDAFAFADDFDPCQWSDALLAELDDAHGRSLYTDVIADRTGQCVGGTWSGS